MLAGRRCPTITRNVVSLAAPKSAAAGGALHGLTPSWRFLRSRVKTSGRANGRVTRSSLRRLPLRNISGYVVFYAVVADSDVKFDPYSGILLPSSAAIPIHIQSESVCDCS